MNKKGALADIFVFMIVGFALTITVGLILYMIAQSGTLLEESFSNTVGPNGQNYSAEYQRTVAPTLSSVNVMKWGLIMVLITMVLSIILGMYLVNVHPIFFVVYIIVMIIAILVAIPFSNMYEDFSTTPQLAETFTGLWGVNFFWSTLPTIVLLTMSFGGILMFINYIHRKDAGGGYV